MRKVGLPIAALMPLLVAGAILTSHGVTPSRWRATLDDPVRATADAADLVTDEDADEGLDMLGNPVTDAVATYKVDATGMLYESHSPQTELPRLAAPKT